MTTYTLPSTNPLLISFLHLLIFVSTITSQPNVLCIEEEKHVLLDFRLSFVADPDELLSNWTINNVDCCAWEGVRCDFTNGHVISLNLYRLTSNGLRPSLLELRHLKSLVLGGNQFPMRIPEFIGSLTKLVVLDLSDSGFFGEIPPQLGNLSNLESLYLGDSNVLHSDNLHWLSRLSSIVMLDLSYFNLSNVIDWASTLHMLPNLSHFYCQSCSLPTPPLSSISHINLASLRSLDISNNNVSSSTFSCLVNGTNNLQTLTLDYMKLDNSNIHEFFGPLINSRDFLLDLSLVGNNLNTIPSELAMFPSLMSLDVSFNRISGSLTELHQHLSSNLTILDVSSNLLNGSVTLDEQLSKFSKLDVLRLSDNSLLTLKFSKSLVPPFQLSTLYLRSCKVGPRFPNWILTQKRLDSLDISNSMISGAIPDAFWDLSTKFFHLNLSDNKINCKLPNLALTHLYYANIDLSFNSFHGAIPFFLFRNILDLSYNNFSSFHPLPPGDLLNRRMGFIHITNNRLLGSLPKWLFQIDSLSSLNLANNNLSGTLPIEIGSLSQLRVLHLSNNKFSGQLPLSMKNFTQLNILELANNKFSGVVPSWVGESMPGLISLNLRSNKFFGELPSTLCRLQGLQILDLSDNEISGCIPGCVHNFTAMSTHQSLSLKPLVEYQFYYSYENGHFTLLDHALVVWKGSLVEVYKRNIDQRNVINLSGNLLRGEIPIGVTTLKELRSLDLSRNGLNGSIPEKIGQLRSLEVLKLSSNRLCGEIPQSLAALTFLNTLNLSNNNLCGRIPSSTQLQTFDPSSFSGNPNLCGKPLLTKCSGDEEEDDVLQPVSDEEDDESFNIQTFLAALGMGFAVNFIGVLGILHFNRRWRIAFFKFADNMALRILVESSLLPSKIKRSLCFTN